MKWDDVEDKLMSAFIIVVALCFLGLLAIGAWALAQDLLDRGERNAAKEHCGINGGRVEYSPPPHEDDWRCVGASVERAP